jgi:glycosyltransferase involved in cell wall biosynthesis
LTKRLLAVSWEMPPMYGPRGTQVSRALGELARLGWSATVVTLAPRRGGPHWRDGRPVDPAPYETVRVASPEEWTIVRAARRFVPALRDRPDPSRPWIAPATGAALRVAARGAVSGLITFAQPWSDHLVGLRVQRRAGLRWAAHFSDPWSDSPYGTNAQRARWRRLEALVVTKADALIFVTRETADLVMRKYPDDWRRKVSIVPHGYDASLAPPPAPLDAATGPLRILHTGRVYAGVRTPSALLRALATLHVRRPLTGRLEVTFLGPHLDGFDREASALGITELVRFEERVTPREAAARAQRADVLLLIDAPSDGPSVFLPSKLVDYLPFRKPILGLTPDPGASAALLQRLGSPTAPPDDADAIARAIEDLIDRWERGVLCVAPTHDRVAAEYDIRRTARLLDDVLTRTFG